MHFYQKDAQIFLVIYKLDMFKKFLNISSLLFTSFVFIAINIVYSYVISFHLTQKFVLGLITL